MEKNNNINHKLNDKTFMANEKTFIKKWFIVDAKNKTLGRLSTKVASILKGKYKSFYTPHVDCGDFVVVINADQIFLTGNKWKKKYYYRHSGYPGGLTKLTAGDMIKKFPTRIVEKAILGMLPHSKLGSKIGKKLFVYAKENYKQKAQKPESLEV